MQQTTHTQISSRVPSCVGSLLDCVVPAATRGGRFGENLCLPCLPVTGIGGSGALGWFSVMFQRMYLLNFKFV